MMKINFNTFFDSVYVINIPERTERLNTFMENWKNTNIDINPIVIKAIVGKNIKNTDLYNILTPEAIIDLNQPKQKFPYQLTLGAVGCYLSHIKIWRQIVEKKERYAIICEDDITFRDNFKQNIEKKIKFIPDDADIILIDHIVNKYKQPSTNINGYELVSRFYRTSCYIINYNTAKKLLKPDLLLDQQIDSALSDLTDDNNNEPLKIYTMDRVQYAYQLNSNSDIQSMGSFMVLFNSCQTRNDLNSQ